MHACVYMCIIYIYVCMYIYTHMEYIHIYIWSHIVTSIILGDGVYIHIHICVYICIYQYISQFSHSVVSDSATPWTVAHQTSLSITNSQSLIKVMSFMSVMPSNHLILCHPLLLPPSVFPSIRVFSNESVLHIR